MGHLVEGAISCDAATGKHLFLEVVKKMMDCVYKVFIEEGFAPYATCGREEIKIGLLRLYDYTGEKKYLDMAARFVNMRGANDKDIGKNWEGASEYYHQDDAPAREMKGANGHAVRACYYYTAIIRRWQGLQSARRTRN